MKKALAMIILIGVAAAVTMVSGLLGYRQRAQSPKHSLLQAQAAIARHDAETFDKYVDVDGVVTSLIDQILEVSLSEDGSRSDWMKSEKAVAAYKPKIINIGREQLVDFIKSGKFQMEKKKVGANGPEFSLVNVWSRSGGDRVQFKGIEYVKEEGPNALAGLKFYHKEYDRILVLELEMANKGDYWQVSRLSNFSEYMKQINALGLARTARINEQIKEDLKRMLIVEGFDKSSTRDDWGIGKKVIVELKLKNQGQKEIAQYCVKVRCSSSEGEELANLTVTGSNEIAPGQTGRAVWIKDMNTFEPADKMLYEIPRSHLKISADIEYIQFKDRSELAPFSVDQPWI